MNVSTRKANGEAGLLRSSATPPTPRVDLDRREHKGLHSCLFDTLLTVGCMDVHEDAYVAHACAQARQLLTLCHALLEIVRSIVPDEMHALPRWMVPAMSPVERAQFFAGMRGSTPAAALASALAAVEPRSSVPQRARLRADLAAV